MKIIYSWLLIVSLLITGAGCGYHLTGGGYIQDGVTRVSVSVFENKSAQIRAGISFANELIREITEKSNTIVVDADKSTRKVIGTVKSVTFTTLSRSSTENVTEREVKAVIDASLIGGDGGIMWSVKNLSATESYTVSNDSVSDEASKDEAVDLIAERVAERLVSQMMSNF